jgi:GST-like protein
MIDLYAAGTGNGQRGAIALEETGLAYRLHRIDLAKGEQRTPEFLARNPMGQIPVIVDSDGPGGKPVTLAQSGAILLYAAEKSGKFLPADPVARWKAMEWMFHVCTDIAITSGAIFQMSVAAREKVPSSIEHFENRLLKFLHVCDGRLKTKPYLADELSVADLALYPVALARKPLIEKAGDLPDLMRWMGVMAARPGIQRALARFA